MNPLPAFVRAFARRSLLRQLLRPLVAFVAVVLAGTLGFALLGGAA